MAYFISVIARRRSRRNNPATSRILGCFAALAMTCLLLPLPAFPEEARIIQPLSGNYAQETWLMEDHALPVISLRIAFPRGGGASDPADKPGLAYLLSDMLARGAGDLDNLHFKQWLEDLAIGLDFSADKDGFYVTLRTLSENRDTAFRLLALALSNPRLEEAELARARDQALARIAEEMENPNYIASLAWNRETYGTHPYAKPLIGSKESIQAITRDALENFRTTYLTRAELHISVVGDISRAELDTLLNKYFMEIPALPAHEPVNIPDFNAFPKGKTVRIEKPLPQSVAVFGARGIGYHDPDYYAASVLNYTVGGGSFESHLMKEIREKRGLAYSVYTYLQSLDHTAVYKGSVGTRTEAMPTSLELIKQEMQRTRDAGITEEELTAAKHYITGSFLLGLDSTSDLAAMLSLMQTEKLEMDYLERRNALVEKVTLEEVNRTAKRLLEPENLIIIVVGKGK